MRKRTSPIRTAKHKLSCAQSASDLKKIGLPTLALYHAAWSVMGNLDKKGSSTETFLAEVADFFQRCGYTVTPKGIGFRISI